MATSAVSRTVSRWCTAFMYCVLITICNLIGQSSLAQILADDFRIISYDDLRIDASVHVYQQQGVADFSQMLIDIPNNQIIVGARDHLMRLDVDNLKELEAVQWSPNNVTVATCIARGQAKENCHNYIRVLLAHEGNTKIFVCGTNAFTPTCTWREATNMENIMDSITGVAKCPFHPSHNTTALMTSNGDLYSATVTDYTGRDPAIYRIMGPSTYLRTVQYNSRWLNEPNFVSTYEIDDFVYFFFRETAVEYINCGKSIFPRVARICKSDTGGKFLLEDNWTTFSKARLNCSLPGSYPFYFSELQGTFFLEDQQLVYAVFTTSPTSVYASAVCVYNTSSFNNAFSGPFKYQENAQMAWGRMPNTLPNMQCPAEAPSNARSAGRMNMTPAQRHLVDAQKYQMMDDAVQPTQQMPVVVAENERFSHIVVHQIKTKHHEKFNVVFLVTLEGYIKKFMNLPGTHKPCLVEEIRVVPPEEVHPVQSFQLSKEKGALFLGMKDRVYRIPVQRCSRFKTKIACMNAMDPYCGWHSELIACTPIPESLPDKHWHQDITSCPILETPVDGDWSKWTDWESCDHQSNFGQCLCRRRSCDNPRPRHGGKHCHGINVQVLNCTTHGNWTDWSEWSSCSASCGVSSRSRRRSCTNPAPAHGGRVCVGPHIETGICHSPPCPENRVAPRHGQWSSWSEWTLCDRNCGGGIRTRHRRCSDPPPIHGGNDCVGNDQEWQRCNEHKCSAMRKASSWTPWSKFNVTAHGYSRERFRFVCKAPVLDEDDVDVSMRHQNQYCDGSECGEPGQEVAGEWSKWSSWTNCDRICGGGQQHRERVCEGGSQASKDCIGHSREVRFCNEHSCQGEWSCWGEYSQCSVSCGTGSRWRRRNCISAKPDGHFTMPCVGVDYEEVQCTMPPCSGASGGWGQWSDWTICGDDNLQRRERICHVKDEDQCQGPYTETRACIYNAIEPMSSEVKEAASKGSGSRGTCLYVYHIVIVGIVGFVLGGVVCVGIFLYCQRQQKENRERFGTLPRCDVKQNEYMAPQDLDMFPPLNNGKYMSNGSLPRKKDNIKNMTVKEATLKRNELLRTNSMRTNLTLMDHEYMDT